jgi:hypothetical protein
MHKNFLGWITPMLDRRIYMYIVKISLVQNKYILELYN